MHLLNLRFGSNDLDKARAFYDATFAALGLAPAPVREDKRLIYKLPAGPSFAIAPPRDGCAATHANGGTIVFEADSDDQVFAWYEAGLANGGTSEGKAEPKPQAGGKIGAYLRDPDGNKLGCYHGVSVG